MNTSVNSKNKRFTMLAWALAILVVVIAVPFVLIFDRLNINIDMTPNSLYTLTDATESYLTDLDNRGITVDVYFLGDFEEAGEELEMLAFYRTVLAYQKHPCFHFVDFDPDTNPELLRSINPDNIYNLSKYDTLFVYGSNVKRLPSSILYTYTTDENGGVTKAEFRGENYYTSYIASVVSGVQPTVAFLEGHGEVAIGEMSQLTANLGNYNYGTESLNLMNAESVPEDVCIIVIAAPKYDITEDEYNKLLAYTERGGNLALFMSPNEEKLAYTFLERLMLSYCIGMDYDKVAESDSGRYYSKDHSIFLCDLVQAGETSSSDLTSALMADSTLPTYMPASRSFYEIYGSNIATCSIDMLIETQSTAYADPCGGTNPDAERIEGQRLTLSMYSEDQLRNSSKMIVFGSADIITNTGLSLGTFYINPLNLFLSSITWMYDSDIDMNIQNKEKTYDSLNVNSSEEASGMIALYVALPLLVAAAGVVVWLRRKDA